MMKSHAYIKLNVSKSITFIVVSKNINNFYNREGFIND